MNDVQIIELFWQRDETALTGSRKQICQLLLCHRMENTYEQGRFRRMCQRYLAGGMEYDSAKTAIDTLKLSGAHHKKLCHK